MARISGIDIPNNKRIVISLTYIYGIGLATSKKILKMAKIDESKRTHELTDSDLSVIRGVMDKEGFMVEGELRRIVSQNIKRYKDIKCYRGLRHLRNLPVRGQKTQKNARTKRGKRVAVGGTNPKAAAKT